MPHALRVRAHAPTYNPNPSGQMHALARDWAASLRRALPRQFTVALWATEVIPHFLQPT